MEEIKSCPFCISNNVDIYSKPHIVNENFYKVYVFCESCGANGPHVTHKNEDEAETTAIKLWNIRTE